MRLLTLLIVAMLSFLMKVDAQRFKCGKIIDPVKNEIRYTSEIIPIGYNHKDHYRGKMYLQAAIFIQNAQYHLSLILDYPTFTVFDSLSMVHLYFQDGSEMQLTVHSQYLSNSKQGSERWRQPEQIFYSHLELPLTEGQVAALERTRIIKIKYNYSTYQINHRSQRILGKMIKRVRQLSLKKQ